MGIASGQVLRVNVTNSSGEHDPPEPERVRISVLDVDGALVAGDSRTLQPGESMFLDVDGDMAPAGSRLALIPLVEIASLRGFPPDPYRVGFPPDPYRVANVEIFSSLTRRTMFSKLPPGPCKAASGGGDFSPVGLAVGETMRLNVLNPLPTRGRGTSWLVELEFKDEMGLVLLSSNVTIPPGGSAHLDLDGDVYVGRAGRGEIIPCVKILGLPVLEDFRRLRGGTPPDPVVATTEVFDNGTLQTTFMHPDTLLPVIAAGR